MRIYVGNLSFNTADQELQALFTTYGQVDSVRLIRDHATGQSRGFGFVEMADAGAGRAACTALDQQEFEGRRLTVSEAKPQEQRSGNGSGYGQKSRDARW
jgi:RNA recognition motif-containing protein